MVVARLTTGGALDTTFNPGGPTPGLVVVDFTERPGANVQAAGVAAGPGGTVVATGIMAVGTFSQEIALVRVTSTGAYDNSFSADGRLVTKVSEVFDAPLDVAVAGAGQVYVAGIGAAGCPPAPARTSPSSPASPGPGILDLTFDNDGHAEPTGTATLGQLNDVDALPDGRAIVAGYTTAPQKVLLARFDSTGGLDGTFSGDGMATPDFGEGTSVFRSASANGVIVDAAGRLLVVGGASPGDDTFHATLARLTPTGDPDMSWGTGFPATGVVRLPSPRAISATDAAPLQDGKVMVTGTGRRFNQNAAIVLARLTDTGALDGTFAPSEPTPGMLQTQLSDSSPAFQLTRPPGGDTLVSASRASGSGENRALVLRYLDGGEPPPDEDGDGDPDASDNCPDVPNPGQEDSTATARATRATPMTTTTGSRTRATTARSSRTPARRTPTAAARATPATRTTTTTSGPTGATTARWSRTLRRRTRTATAGATRATRRRVAATAVVAVATAAAAPACALPE